MKFALYQPWIYLHGGLERSLLELVKRSQHQWTIYTGHYDRENSFPEFKQFDVRELTRLSVKRDMASVLLVAAKIMAQKIDLKEYDALVVWCDGMGDMITFRNNEIPVFNICSTPLRPVFDPQYVKQALSERSQAGRMAFRLFQLLFKAADTRAWKKYSGVIATSKEVKARIIKGGLYKDGPSMALYHPGIDWESFAGEKAYDPFLLVPGRIMWTKNIELAIQAFLKADLPKPWKLVVAGFLDQKSEPYLNKLKNLAADSDRVVFELSPSDEKLYKLYSSAAVILFPPLNEDWGIVPLEAMANAKPVLANRSGGPKESILHNETGWLVAPEADAWAKVIKIFPDNIEQVRTMGEKGRIHARKYDWSEFVNGIDNAFEKWVKNEP